jgi:DNA-binding IclR family transcriptional regulator
MANYTSDSQQRILKVLLVLAGNEFNGITPVQIRKTLELSAATITRDLANLETAGLAERIPGQTEKWRLGPKMIQIAIAFQREWNANQKRMEEFEQRYIRC